jgi:hypothetical protein
MYYHYYYCYYVVLLLLSTTTSTIISTTSCTCRARELFQHIDPVPPLHHFCTPEGLVLPGHSTSHNRLADQQLFPGKRKHGLQVPCFLSVRGHSPGWPCRRCTYGKGVVRLVSSPLRQARHHAGQRAAHQAPLQQLDQAEIDHGVGLLARVLPSPGLGRQVDGGHESERSEAQIGINALPAAHGRRARSWCPVHTTTQQTHSHAHTTHPLITHTHTHLEALTALSKNCRRLFPQALVEHMECYTVCCSYKFRVPRVSRVSTEAAICTRSLALPMGIMRAPCR